MFKVDFNTQSMKILRVLSLLLVSAVLLTYMGCDGGGSTPEPIEDVQFTKLAKTWKISTVSRNSVDQTANYTGFQLVLGGIKGTPPFSYTTTGRPSLSPWPASGTWEFGSAVETQILRYNTIDDDVRDITYTVTESTLTLTFTYPDGQDGYSRTKEIQGPWIFTFTL